MKRSENTSWRLAALISWLTFCLWGDGLWGDGLQADDTSPASRPNVIIILTDNQGPWPIEVTRP